MAKDSELWDVICDGPFVPTKNLGDPTVPIPKMRKGFLCVVLAVINITRYQLGNQQKRSERLFRQLTREQLRMKDDESIQDIHTQFTSIIKELHSLGESIQRNKLVRKILNVLPSSWESKVNTITEAKDL
ncbi:uncharacterized protein LOC142181820 [Nicotiana tabacum]|uniref:Uncharacterized protein LOC142181820 n=1 Tax=Nicotiana tabacum TaxID=4097 RepID=A0AC58UPQ4_TOBAC